MRLFLEITDERPPDVSKRRFREFSRNGMAAVGKLWESTYKMLHFAAGAADRYGYQRRSKQYQQGKERRVRNRSHRISPDAERELIYSGKLRQAARQKQIARAFPSRVTINIPTPHYVAMKPRRPSIPNLGMEMTSTLFSERREMQAEYHREVEEDLNTYRATRTTRIGA